MAEKTVVATEGATADTMVDKMEETIPTTTKKTITKMTVTTSETSIASTAANMASIQKTNAGT